MSMIGIESSFLLCLASIAQNRLFLHARILFSKVSIIMISKSDVFLFGASAIHNDRCD